MKIVKEGFIAFLIQFVPMFAIVLLCSWDQMNLYCFSRVDLIFDSVTFSYLWSSIPFYLASFSDEAVINHSGWMALIKSRFIVIVEVSIDLGLADVTRWCL